MQSKNPSGTTYHLTNDGERLGPKMRAALRLVDQAGPVQSKKWIAERVGPNGSLKYGYRIVNRCISAGVLSWPDSDHKAANPHGSGAVTVTDKGERVLERL